MKNANKMIILQQLAHRSDVISQAIYKAIAQQVNRNSEENDKDYIEFELRTLATDVFSRQGAGNIEGTNIWWRVEGEKLIVR